MAKKSSGAKSSLAGTRSPASSSPAIKGPVRDAVENAPATRQKPSALLDTRVVYCGDNLEQLAKRSHKVIVTLTVQEILDEHIAKKLA